MVIANKAKPATNKPVIAPDLNAIVSPDCKLDLAASAVLTLAFTEINIPTYPATPDRKVTYDCPFLLNLGHLDTHPNPWHRVENSRTAEPRISFRLMCNEKYAMKHWVDLYKQGNLLNAKS